MFDNIYLEDSRNRNNNKKVTIALLILAGTACFTLLGLLLSFS